MIKVKSQRSRSNSEISLFTPKLKKYLTEFYQTWYKGKVRQGDGGGIPIDCAQSNYSSLYYSLWHKHAPFSFL